MMMHIIFYVSQLRITIKRAFGVLVHRWAILRRPLACPLYKVGPTVMCLCRLHNFCTDANEKDALKSMDQDAIYSFQFLDALKSRPASHVTQDDSLVQLEQGRHNALLHGGYHF